MNFTVPEGIAALALAAILGIVGWGFRRMVSTQDGMAQSMTTMSLDITRLCGKIELAGVLQANHKQTCDDRHRENVDRLEEIHDDIDRLQTSK